MKDVTRPHVLLIVPYTLRFTVWSVDRVASQRLNTPTTNGNRLLLYLQHPHKGAKWHRRSSITAARLSWLLDQGWKGTVLLVSKQRGVPQEAEWLAEVWKPGPALDLQRSRLTQLTRAQAFAQAEAYAAALSGLPLPRPAPVKAASASRFAVDKPAASGQVPNG